MGKPAEKLAASLKSLQTLQKKGVVAINSAEISRIDRERLLKEGYLKTVMKGWYIASRPDEPQGESTAWYASFWDFMSQYLTSRFGDQWSLSPEQSLILHSGNRTVPPQLLIRASAGQNTITEFPHHTSIVEVRANVAAGDALTIDGSLRLFEINAALVEVSGSFYADHPTDAGAILGAIPDASALLARLLEGGHTRAAGRLAGAFRNIGKDRIANEILAAMKAAMHDVREKDPFERILPVIGDSLPQSPHVSRIKLMWQGMREIPAGRIPETKLLTSDIGAYLAAMDDIYILDAYHSLSIEGYQVSEELIERVRKGDWNPDDNESDQKDRNAMAARGYWQAFQSVKKTIRSVLEGKNPGQAIRDDFGNWYRELFAPSVAAGLVDASQLAGYRNGPVYIRGSMHVPLRAEAVRDCMPVFFELLKEETDPVARIILGHFIFVYIHPYVDGNGRMARFLMNVMIAAAGLPWAVIRLEHRDDYMAALENASLREDIAPFTEFVVSKIIEK
jgi:hypothetical protein